MTVRTYWVEASSIGRLAVVGRPRAARDFAELKAAGVDVLISLQQVEEAAMVGLAEEAALCEAAGIVFHRLEIADHGIPKSLLSVEELAHTVKPLLAAGKGVAAHCYAGLGRSPLMIAAIMIDHGIDAMDACDLISVARGVSVPEMASQIDWLLSYEMRRHR